MRSCYFLSPSDIKRLLKLTSPHSQLGISVRLMLYSGLRINEVRCFTRNDMIMSLNTGMLIVRKDIAKYNKPRSVPLCNSLASSLTKYLNINKVEGRIWKCSIRTVHRKLASFFDGLNMPNRAHDLRHTYAVSLYQILHDASLVQALMGHRDLKTTMCYLHLDGMLQIKMTNMYKNFNPLPARKKYKV